MLKRLLGIGAVLAFLPPVLAESDLATLPVRRVTVFKDGHAFVELQGEVEVDERGEVTIGNLPNPVMGTFWSEVVDRRRDDRGPPAVELQSVTYREQDILEKSTIKTMDGVLHANVGKRVRFQFGGKEVQGRISQADLGGKMVLLESDEGYQLFPVARIETLKFLSQSPVTHSGVLRRQPVLHLRLKWKAERRRTTAIGLQYLQKGIRWIPGYRIVLRSDGSADVRLQATLINELVDLKGAEVKLVVGVPSFLFQESVDPMGGSNILGGESNGLSQYFHNGRNERHGLSNALVTQVSRMSEYRSGMGMTSGPAPFDPATLDADSQSELHVFSIPGVDLPIGSRQVRTLGQWRLPASEIFKLVVQSQPPIELRSRSNTEQMNRLLEMTRSPKVKRVVRIRNTSDSPFTTAPVLILDGPNGSILAQGIMTYTSVGGEVDLEVTDAMDFQVASVDQEVKRSPNHEAHDGHRFGKIDIASRLTITNFRSRDAVIEVERHVHGQVDDIFGDGRATKLAFPSNRKYPDWYWYSGWPTWWPRLNPNTSVKWSLRVPAAASETVGVDWHYLWR